jgi:hypothetical protein
VSSERRAVEWVHGPASVTLIKTARLNDVNAQEWLTDMLAASTISTTTNFTSSCPGIGKQPRKLAA